MSFWPLRRRRKEPGVPTTPIPAKPVAAGLSVVELWTADQRATVGIDLSQGRLTDLFNREDTIRVVQLGASPEDPSKLVEKRPEQEWVELEVEQALLVFPPPQATNPNRRLHRPRQPIEIVIGPFEVSGTVSIPPGGPGCRLHLPAERPIHPRHAGGRARYAAGGLRAASRGGARQSAARRDGPRPGDHRRRRDGPRGAGPARPSRARRLGVDQAAPAPASVSAFRIRSSSSGLARRTSQLGSRSRVADSSSSA